MKLRCGHESSVWREEPPESHNAYRVECGACGRFAKWGTEAELHSLKFRLENLSEQMSQIGKDKDRMISEIARLNAELKEKKLILAKQEREEWQSIGWRNELKRKLGKLGARFSGSGEEEKQKGDESLPPHADL